MHCEGFRNGAQVYVVWCSLHLWEVQSTANTMRLKCSRSHLSRCFTLSSVRIQGVVTGQVVVHGSSGSTVASIIACMLGKSCSTSYSTLYTCNDKQSWRMSSTKYRWTIHSHWYILYSLVPVNVPCTARETYGILLPSPLSYPQVPHELMSCHANLCTSVGHGFDEVLLLIV